MKRVFKDCNGKEQEITDGYVHEALHACMMCIDQFNDHVHETPLMDSDKKLKKKAGKIVRLMGELYQQIGQIEYDEFIEVPPGTSLEDALKLVIQHYKDNIHGSASTVLNGEKIVYYGVEK